MQNDSDAPTFTSSQEESWAESFPNNCKSRQEAIGTEPAALTGYDLVTLVLNHPDGSVGALINLAGGAETDWLEFKAAMIGRHEDRKNPNENDADGHWNVAEAVIAMANTRGGAILVGINDDGKPVGLQAGDPRKVIALKGLEAYRRIEIKDRICPPNGPCKWQTGLRGTWELQEAWPPDQFSVCSATHNGHEIAIILVRPVPANGSCLLALQNGEERLLRRTLGHIGQVEPIKRSRDIAQFESNRSPHSQELHSLWERFRKWAGGEETQDEALESAINAWHDKLRAKVADLLVAFTPLDATENEFQRKNLEAPVPRNLFEPQAVETMPDYLRDDFDDDDDDDDGACSYCEESDYIENSSLPPRRGGLLELLAAEPRAVVLGEPGSGKTTCLRRLALDSMTNYKPGDPVTLYVPLTRWRSAGGLWSLIRRRTGLSPQQVEQLIAANRCRLLLDALNECPDALRPTAIDAIAELLREQPRLPVVITARTCDITDAFLLPTFTVEPLNGEQRKEFLRTYLGDPQRAEKFLEQIHSQPGGESLAANPLLLRMVVEVARKHDDLPAGRALLYRQWISDWYIRELGKTENARDPIPWSLDETRFGLAAIALASRREGLRYSEDKLALEALEGVVKDPFCFLERMTAGLLILRDEGRIEFRHETFQEYLCAEALLANPYAINRDSLSDKTTWGMVIVQAAQLDNLPKPLADIAWIMDPWLGAAISSREMRPKELENQRLLWSDHALEALLFLNGEGPCPKMTQSPLEPGWYKKSDPTLRDAIVSIPGANERWLEFESKLLRNVITQDLLVLEYLQNCIGEPSDLLERAGSGIKDYLLANCGPICAKGLCDIGIFDAGDFANRKQHWIAEATPIEAIACVKAKRFSINANDFACRRTELAEKADAQQAGQLVYYRICKPKDFETRKLAMIADISSNLASYLVYTKICTPEDFAERRVEFAAEAGPKEAAQLVRTKICAANDFQNRKADLSAQTDPEQVSHLVSARILDPEDFSIRRAELAAKAGPGQAGHLVWAEICNAEDFSERRMELAANAKPEQAEQLVSAGICTPEDFSGRRTELAAKAHNDKVSLLVSTKICSPEDFANRRTELASQAKADEVRFLIDSHICTVSDFAHRKFDLAAEANAMEAGHLVRREICSPEDFANRRTELAIQAGAGDAAFLVYNRICTASDFADRRTQLASEASVAEAGNLVRQKICSPEDFEDRREELASKADAVAAGHLVRHKICTREDFANRRDELAFQADAWEAAFLVDTRICTESDFAARRAELASKANVAEAGNLIRQKICSPEDFADRRAAFAAGANSTEAGQLICYGICTVEDFGDRRHELATKAGATAAGHLVRHKICAPEDFANRRTELAIQADAEEAAYLVDSQICTASDFADRRLVLAAGANPTEAGHLVRHKICAPEDFVSRRTELAVKAEIGEAIFLVDNRICMASDFADRRPELAAKANAKEAGYLVRLRICSSRDFFTRRAELAGQADPRQAVHLLRRGICSAEDFASRREEWIAFANPEQALYWVSNGLFCFNAKDFASRRKEFSLISDPVLATQLVHSGICRASDFEYRKMELADQADMEAAIELARAGICTSEDFAHRRANWVATATPKQAVSWLKEGLFSFTAKDFTERCAEWISLATPEQVAAWIKVGLCRLEDASARRSEWIASATPKQAAVWIKQGLLAFKAEEFAVRRAEWIAEASPEQIGDWEKQGLFTSNKSGFIESKTAKGIRENDSSECISTEPHKIKADLNQLSPNPIAAASNESGPGWSAPSISSLNVDICRTATSQALANRWFNGVISYVASDASFAFIRNSAFPEQVFCHRSKWTAKAVQMKIGSEVRFQVLINKNKKKDAWGYVAKNVKVLRSPEEH